MYEHQIRISSDTSPRTIIENSDQRLINCRSRNWTKVLIGLNHVAPNLLLHSQNETSNKDKRKQWPVFSASIIELSNARRPQKTISAWIILIPYALVTCYNNVLNKTVKNNITYNRTNIIMHGRLKLFERCNRTLYSKRNIYHSERLLASTVSSSSSLLDFPTGGDSEYGHKTHADLHKFSIANPTSFWGKLAESRLKWSTPFETVQQCDMSKGELAWFIGGKLNISGNFQFGLGQ